MSEEAAVSSGDENQFSESLDFGITPSEEQLELAEKILSRLEPCDRSQIGRMIHSRARVSGGILAGLLVFWWLAVQRIDFDTDDTVSIFFNTKFGVVTLMVPFLVFFGSLLNDLSRELGQLFPGMVAGAMFLLSILYVIEPLVMGFFSDSLGPAEGMWRMVRLLVLGSGVWLSAKLMIDAILLGWVKRLMENFNGLDLSPEDTLEEITPIAEPSED